MGSMRRRGARLAATAAAILIAPIAISACAPDPAARSGDRGPEGTAAETAGGDLARGVDEIIAREMKALPMAGVSVAMDSLCLHVAGDQRGCDNRK